MVMCLRNKCGVLDMQDRKTKVRLQFQRIIGGFFIMIAAVLFVVVGIGEDAGNMNSLSMVSKDASGAVLIAALGFWMLLSKSYVFWTGEE